MPIKEDNNSPMVITIRPWASSVELCSSSIELDEDFLDWSVETSVQTIMPEVMVATDTYFSVEKLRFKMSFDMSRFMTKEPARKTMWRVRGMLNEKAQLLIAETKDVFEIILKQSVQITRNKQRHEQDMNLERDLIAPVEMGETLEWDEQELAECDQIATFLF